MAAPSNISKSFYTEADPLIAYTTGLSTQQEPIQKEIQEATLAGAEIPLMVGAPEVLQLGKSLIHLIGAKKVLDVGTFTGASALAWALALPDCGKVISMDVTFSELDKCGRKILAKRPDLLKKIDFRLGSAVDTLDSLISSGQSGTFDFAFIDADKQNYCNYYEKCMTLLRPGGVIMVDNALWQGQVVKAETEFGKAIDAMNRLVAADNRSLSCLINMGDGVHLCIKKKY